jgi:hypothetical protein
MLPFARSSMKTKCTPKLDAMDPCQRPRSTGPAAWRNLRQTCGRRPFATAPETPRRAERGSPIMTVSKSGLVQASVPRFAGRRRPERHRAPQRAQSWPARPYGSWVTSLIVPPHALLAGPQRRCAAELRNSRFASASCRDDGWSRVEPRIAVITCTSWCADRYCLSPGVSGVLELDGLDAISQFRP